MKEEFKYNLIKYLQNNTKKQIIVTVLLGIFFIGIIMCTCILDVENIENINVQTFCDETCVIKFYTNGVMKENYTQVKIKDKKYQINAISFGEPQLNNLNEFFQEVSLDLKDYHGKNNEIVEMKIYKNKEKIIKKILKLIVER